jgi:hypothetical protein
MGTPFDIGYSSSGGGDPVTVEKANVVGDITVGSEEKKVGTWNDWASIEGLFVGGLAGAMRGSGASARAELKNSTYSQGTIRVFSTCGTTRVGGAIGVASLYTDVSDCSGNAKDIEVNMYDDRPHLYVGGFVADIRFASNMKNCSSENPIVGKSIDGFTGDVYVGGFTGRIDNGSRIEYCYAKGNVTGISGSLCRAGGFAGEILGGNFVQYCYATGNVSSLTEIFNQNYHGWCYAGGFAGSCNTLSNCYATGDVFLDWIGITVDIGDDLYAGALVAEIKGSGNTVGYCFATGSVTIQRSLNPTTVMGAGGLVGKLGSNTLQNSAALGASIICTGSTNRHYIGRVCGITDGPLFNNNAYSGLSLYQSATYKDSNPTRVNPLSPAPAHNNANGKDVIDGDFRRRDIWQNESTDNPTLPIHGLGFSSDHWIFTTVGYLGHPILRASPNGPAMGGQ